MAGEGGEDGLIYPTSGLELPPHLTTDWRGGCLVFIPSCPPANKSVNKGGRVRGRKGGREGGRERGEKGVIAW